LAAILGRPLVSLVHHHANMGVASAVLVVRAGAALAPCRAPVADVEMPMVSVEVDHFVRARIGLDRVRALVMCAGDHVPQAAVPRVDEKDLAMLIPIVPPRVGRSRAKRLERLALRVIAPNAAAERSALLFGRAGQADIAGARRAAATVQPTVGAPVQS